MTVHNVKNLQKIKLNIFPNPISEMGQICAGAPKFPDSRHGANLRPIPMSDIGFGFTLLPL